MAKPNLVLIKTIDTPHDEITEEFTRLKDSLPEGTQMSMFDILVHNEGETWFAEALKRIQEEKE